jgi:hypothetical protein
MPTCSKCKTEKPLNDFCASKRDGYRQPCKGCARAYRQSEGYKAYMMNYWQSDRGKRIKRESNIKWKASPHGKVSNRLSQAKTRKRPDYLIKKQAWRESNRARTQGYATKWNHSEKGAAARERDAYKRKLARAFTLIAIETLEAQNGTDE